jgi:hypothetical protein
MPLSPVCRLMRVLRTVIAVAVLAMFDTREHLSLCGTVALDLVRDDHPGNILAALEQLAEEFLRSHLVSLALDQDIEDIAGLIDSPPEIAPLAVNREKYLIQMPLVTRPRALATQLVRVGLTKLATPFADRFIRHDDATGKQQLFDIPVVEAEPAVEPDAMADDLGREAVVFGPPAATGRKFTVRRSDVHSPHENRYLVVFQTAGKSGLRKPQ